MDSRIGHSVIWLPEVDSTSDELARLTSHGKGLDNGQVIAAINQTSGRGMGQNIWESQAGMNLTFSFLVRPHFLDASQQFLVNIFVSLALLKYLLDVLPGQLVSIKWPNDIYVGSNKIAGILIAHSVSGNTLQQSIIGIGLNVNQLTFPEGIPNPISLKQITGKSYDLKASLAEMLVHLDRQFKRIAGGNYTACRTEYMHALLGYQKWRKYRFGNEILSARILNVEDTGQLMLEKEDNEFLLCGMQEIDFIL